MDAQSYDIEQHKKKTCQFLDELLVKRKEQQALHYELHKNIAIQCRVSERQAEALEDQRAKITTLEKKLEEAQGADLKGSLEAASSELNVLRSANKDLESKLKEAEEKWKLIDDYCSELERAQSDLQAKRVVDLDVIKKLQKEVKSLRNFMTRAEAS
ncbi:hypothetical protein QYE76_000156 [Lolium multiflorum]|uniref:Uncharacterized protein n=1 Tax=Lolium multiflorum TaxID=4521 RepID=A0AAD8RLC8_LOLMU|nr:hypothetical protein QYE76_000156 [Lolium multiflorum]